MWQRTVAVGRGRAAALMGCLVAAVSIARDTVATCCNSVTTRTFGSPLASHSTSGWSISGSRTSSACAMLARSTLVRMSPGSQILRSAYWARDSPSLAGALAMTRALRLADGPDEVHLGVVARLELAPYLRARENGPAR